MIGGAFRDRREAGRRLGAALAAIELPRPLVLGIPRGGVPVAWEVAAALRAPLDVLIVRKLGHPLQPELAIGAIASGGVRVLNPEAMGDVTPAQVDEIAAREQGELERREQMYRGGRPPVDPAGRTAILVDDGLATGSSVRAAIAALRARGPARIVVAVPVAPRSTCREIRAEVDDLICLEQPVLFFAVGQFYEDFTPTSDEEVAELLGAAPAPAG